MSGSNQPSQSVLQQAAQPEAVVGGMKWEGSVLVHCIHV